ncbi:MAG: hypothetical protein H6R10_1114 [Rhodocyclaceae bacterium]|nr:hypothetical protein [Rhodocyclaceae bacterium]
MSVFGKLSHLVRRRQSARPAHHPFLAEVASLFGPGLARVPDFEARLKPALAFAIEYFDREIASIPGPFVLAPETYGSDGFLTSIFPTTGDIATALNHSIEVRESLPSLADSGHVQVHALLGMRRRPGDGASGQPPVFADHTLRSLAPTEQDTRNYLRLVAVDRLLKGFGEHVQRLRRQDEAPVKELAPENMLRGLLAWLNSPAEHLRITPNAVRWGWGDGTLQYELPTMHSADRRQWIVCLVRFSAQTGLAALHQATARPNRYILI